MLPQEILQDAQTRVGKVQMLYHDTDAEFWALGLAWEAIRLAWYVVDGNLNLACGEKLPLVKSALSDFERNATP